MQTEVYDTEIKRNHRVHPNPAHITTTLQLRTYQPPRSGSPPPPAFHFRRRLMALAQTRRVRCLVWIYLLRTRSLAEHGVVPERVRDALLRVRLVGRIWLELRLPSIAYGRDFNQDPPGMK